MDSGQQEYQEIERKGKTIIFFYEEYKELGKNYIYLPPFMDSNIVDLIKKRY